MKKSKENAVLFVTGLILLKIFLDKIFPVEIKTDTLQDLLNKAVTEERYEDAAKLRDEINAKK